MPVAYRSWNHGSLNESSWLFIQWLSVVTLFAPIIWSETVIVLGADSASPGI
jgi:hypothetical protein